MKWNRPVRLPRLKDRLRAGGRQRADSSRPAVAVNVDPLRPLRAASVCIASGKGGTGKSLLTASLGCLFARSAKTLIVDGDLGVGNAHILQNVSPRTNIADLVDGETPVDELVTPCRKGLDLIGAGSGIARLASLSVKQLHAVACGLERIELCYDYLLVDSAAGISHQTIAFAAASDVLLLVTTPDVTALTDAYAFFKVLLQRRPQVAPLLVINRVTSDREAQSAAERIAQVSRKFLGREPRWIGNVHEDEAVHLSVQRREPLVLCAPESRAGAAIEALHARLVHELAHATPDAHRGLGRTLQRHVAVPPARGRVDAPTPASVDR